MVDDRPPAVVLLSGGLDSATVLAMARDDGFAAHALSFDYGQRHRAELIAAALQAERGGAASHRVATIDLRAFGGSALTSDLAVPKDRDPEASGDEIPVTYVPARNTIFLSFALGLAEVLGARDVYLGVNAVDYSGYPDCRPAYIEAFGSMANLATRAGVESPDGSWLRIHAPLIEWSKVAIIRRGLELGVDYGLTHSCYDPVADAGRALGCRPCEHCDACLIRQRAFEELGGRDPALG
ncbi:7-cyano-7-deazaguanine synthase QueC [Mucisphaera calidilacus]|uniref:7-cyano-7-deazaguanine synthase n=1 Tax=Mucisphaera calidilacus TaxID=2527982 RepID=A0A518BUL9_9BACT|nr:7-cyano-7-deazaguanine synthase QueC [Mucisphaera calidilacus]QDU70678.1 7-cyano-7-deazaguanine synthase [Mucisphaera calidilacus]